MSGIDAVLFDLDGTLCDSAPDLANALDKTLDGLGLAKAGDRMRAWVGDGVGVLVDRALTDATDDAQAAALKDQAMAAFLEHYAAGVCVDSKLFPGMSDLLKWLKSEKIALGVVTNKPEAFTEPLLVGLGIRKYFKSVISGDSLGERKPHPLPVSTAAGQLGADIARTVMVGDSKNDFVAGRDAGAKTALFTFGYHGGVDLGALGSDGVFDSVPELARWLHALARTR